MRESFPGRWPWLTFGVLPFLCITVASLALAFALYALSEMHLGTDPLVQKEFFAVRAVLIWGAPVAVSALFAYVAYRSRVPLRWPLLATVLVCVLAAMINVDLSLNPPGTAPGGSLDMGFGTGPGAWPTQVPRALLTAGLVIVPLLWLTRRARRSGTG